MIAAFAAMQNAQAQTRLQGQREFFQSQQPVHRGMSGGVIDPSTGREGGNPFDNGFFKTPAERQQIIDTRSVGMPGGPAMPQAQPQQQQPMPQPQMPQQQLPPNPMYPQQPLQQRQAQPAPTGYRPAWNASPRPGFSFGAGMR